MARSGGTIVTITGNQFRLMFAMYPWPAWPLRSYRRMIRRLWCERVCRTHAVWLDQHHNDLLGPVEAQQLDLSPRCFVALISLLACLFGCTVLLFVCDTCPLDYLTSLCWTDPAITSVEPSLGSSYGTYFVTIKGTDLGSGSDVTSVSLAGVPATISAQTSTQILVIASFTSSNSTTGIVNISSASYGNANFSAFTYTAVYNSTPSQGWSQSDTLVTVNGLFQFVGSTHRSRFGANVVPATRESLWRVTCNAPPAARGTVTVSVTWDNSVFYDTGSFRYYGTHCDCFYVVVRSSIICVLCFDV